MSYLKIEKYDYYLDKDWLEHKYVVDNLNTFEIAKICNRHPRTIQERLKKFGIPRRKRGSHKWTEEERIMKGEWVRNHPEIIRMKGKNHSIETKIKMSKNRLRDKNGNWKGGVTFITRLYRKTNEYQKWRKLVLKRDGYKCMYKNCGSAATIAHHILPYKDYPELRIDIDNGIALCFEHHKEIHKKLWPTSK